VTVDVVDRGSGSVHAVPVKLDPQSHAGRIELELVPGASAVQVVVRVENSVRSWIEVQAQPGEAVGIEFRRDQSGAIRAFSLNRDFLVLPDEEPGDPLLLKPAKTGELDLLVLVDGTCLHPYAEPAASEEGRIYTLEYLLDPKLAVAWQRLVGQITAFVSAITAKYPQLWAMAAAFGDHPMPILSNPLLKPKYLVYPEIPNERKLEASTPDQLAQQLRRLPFSPGGDFVDALADGLRASRRASWRQNSRKLLLIFGQSPGYSVLAPGDGMTDLQVRKVCIEEESVALQKMGVEIVTIYHDPPNADEAYSSQMPDLVDRSRRQHERLASLREWSGVSSMPDFTALSTSWLSPPTVIAKGPSPGFLTAKATG
jgi:hypothetical protein